MLRLLTFGGLSLVDDGVAVTGAASQRSRLALLAVLAASGAAGISRDKLLALLWPESDEERARHALKQGVYALRRDLGNENAVVGTATLSLDPAVIPSDVREFDEALARGDDLTAASLYVGPFLDGVFVKSAPEFDQWAAGERSRLERAHLDAVGRLARAAEASGDFTSAAKWWRRAAAAEPLSGRVALSLMRVLADSGDVSAAIQHARVHEAVVKGELDSPADDAVLAFAEELRRGEYVPPVRAPRADAATRAPTQSQPDALNLREGESTAAIPVPSNEVPVPAGAERTLAAAPTAGAPSPRSRRWLAMAGAVVLLVVATILLPGMRARWSPSVTPVAAASARRIVVTRFNNNTRDRSLDYIGKYAAEWLVRSLTEADFEVFDAENSALFAFPGRPDTTLPPTNPAVLAAQRGAATVITGSYYRQGDSLSFDATLVDAVHGMPLHPIRPAVGTLSEVQSLLGTMARRVTFAMVAAVDSTVVGARTATVSEPPSLEAYDHATRGWEMFFTTPGDTTSAFVELRRAAAADTTYFVPRLMRAYILDVKEAWPQLAQAVGELDPRRGRMGRVEREALAMFDADLRGDLLGRLRASREMMKLSPGNAEMALLVAISASYLNYSALAYDALNGSDPNLGINAVSPMYWSWHAVSEHTMGRFDDELKSATILARRFPSQRYGALALARVHAARGDTAALRKLLESSGALSASPTLEARSLALEAGRELRAHGHAQEADQVFARAAAAPVRTGATTEERTRYAQALYEAGDLARARTVYAALLAADPGNIDHLGSLGAIAVRMGDSTAAQQVDRRLLEWRVPYSMGRPQYWRAHLAALSGRGAEAVELLHGAVSAGLRLMDLQIVTLHEDRDFAPLWTNSSFRELVRPRSGTPVIP